MFESTTSWLTGAHHDDMFVRQEDIRRGNTHEFFAPVSVYPTSDGYVYIAVGNDKQFQAFSSLPEFSVSCRRILQEEPRAESLTWTT